MENELIYQNWSEQEAAIEDAVLMLFEANHPELAAGVKERLTQNSAQTRLTIAFVGQHNAGKSTVVSSLTNDKSIKISSNVETDTTGVYEWGNVLLYDTPGLYAGVKESHDEAANEAISSADLLVFCITSSLFDDLLIHNFVHLAYERAYRNKIILLVNKMSQEEGDFEELKANYTETLRITLEEAGGHLEDFPIAFIDAKDYKDGIEDDDEELVEFSHFEDFVQVLNQQIDQKGLYAKIGTRCSLLSDAIGEAIAQTGTELDKNMMTVLNRMSRTIANYRRQMRASIDLKERELKSNVMSIGDEMVSKIGKEELDDALNERINRKIEESAADTVFEIEQNLSNLNVEMTESIGDVLTSDIGSYVFSEIAMVGQQKNESTQMATVSENGYMDLIRSYEAVAQTILGYSDKVAKMAMNSQAVDLVELASSQGSKMEKIVVNVGQFFGKSFKPWEATKIANKIGRAAEKAGPVLAVVDVALVVANKLADEKRNAEIQKARTGSFNEFAGIATDIVKEIDKQYGIMENELFGSKLREIDKIRTAMMEEAKNNSQFVTDLKTFGKQLQELSEKMFS